MAQTLRHAILGAGGVGGLIGACLAQSGAPVTMVVRQEALGSYPERLQLESPFGNFSIPIFRETEVPSCDVLWLTVKATQLQTSLPAITNPSAFRAMVPLLNGIDHLPFLRGKYGADKVIPATIAVESERAAPGRIIHRSPFARLSVASAGRELLAETLNQLQKIGLDCRFVDDESTLMWTKLVFLAPLALSTTAAGLSVGTVLKHVKWGPLREACAREACAVATAEGAKVNPEIVIEAPRNLPGDMRSSMQKDVERGNAPELDAIAGPILRGGKRHRIAVPATGELASEVGRRSAGPVRR